MPVTKRDGCNKARFLQNTRENTPSSGKSLISTLQFQFQSHYHSNRWSGGGRLFEFDWEGEGVEWALIRGWALINFFCLWDGRLFEVGANSRLGAYSSKYGISGSYFSGGEKRRSEIPRLVAWGKKWPGEKTSSGRAWAYWQRMVSCTAAPFPPACGRNVAINIKVTIVRRTMKLNSL